jgi:3-isopropylmalate dehydrogenase
MILSVAMMFRFALGLEVEAAAVDRAVARALADGIRTADLVAGDSGRAVGCRQMAKAISERVTLSRR